MKIHLSEENKDKKYHGFTFVEIIVVIAIIGILSTISIISFSPLSKRTKVNASADEVASAMNLAKGYALQGRMPAGFTSICGYGFKFTSTTQYQIFYYYHYAGGNLDCSDRNNFTEMLVSEQTLKTGTVLNSPAFGATATIYFSIPRATVVFPPANPYFNIVYSGTPSLQKTVRVSANGLIE
ncbi:MAG: prepilin-type N-terminal cleavage/methylation domain-containing protein [Parcubacteria group bacterium]